MGSDELVDLVGRPLTDVEVRTLLDGMQVPWQPSIQPPWWSDSVTIRNVELIFEDAAYFAGAEPRSHAALVLSQLCFYSPAPGTEAAASPPLGLLYRSERHRNRQQLGELGGVPRLSTRDAYELASATFVLGYDRADALDSVLVVGRRGDRASRAQPPLGFTELAALFGRPWHDAVLRDRLYSLAGAPSAMQQIKKHGTCSLIREAGVKLLYRVAAGTRVFDGVEIYRSRVLDAAKWVGDLPFGIDFSDSVDDVSRKAGVMPHDSGVRGLESHARWTVNGRGLLVVFDSVVNLIASITIASAERWSS